MQFSAVQESCSEFIGAAEAGNRGEENKTILGRKKQNNEAARHKCDEGKCNSGLKNAIQSKIQCYNIVCIACKLLLHLFHGGAAFLV